MRRLALPIVVLLVPFALLAGAAEARVPVTLKGSPHSMTRQNQVATDLGYTFAETAEDVDTLVEKGELVPLEGDDNYDLLEYVSYPVARPEVRLFIERLAAQYHEATGEKLGVTSLTRPSEGQPANAHALSVHPAGIAIDLRVSKKAASRQWLESTLLALERKGVLDVTREYYPPHYHVALFPSAYVTYLEGVIGADAVARALHPVPEIDPMALRLDTLEQKVPTHLAAAAMLPGERERPWFPASLVPLLLATFGVLGYRHAKRLVQQ